MRRAEGFGLGVMAGAALLQAGLAQAAEVVAPEPATGSTLLIFGVATLVPAVAVYTYFRRRELRGVPEAPVKTARAAKPKTVKAKRLPAAKANPVAQALEAKVVAAARPVPEAVAPPIPAPPADDGAQQPA